MSEINKTLFAPWVNKSINKTLIKGLNGWFPSSSTVSSNVKCSYSENPKIRTSVVSALMKIVNIFIDETNSSGGAGKAFNNGTKGECVEIIEGGITQTAVIMNGKIMAIKKSGDSYLSYTFKEGKDNGCLLLAAILFHEIMSRKTPELINAIQFCISCVKDNIDNNHQLFTDNAAIVSEIIYHKLCKGEYDVAPLNASGNVFKLTELAIESKKYECTPLRGKFTIVNNKEATVEEKTEKNETNNSNNTSVFNDKKYSEFELQLIPKLEPWYIVPKMANEICTLIKESTTTYKPKRNFMFRGPSSTGKSSLCRAIASMLKIPYVYITCSSDTESGTFLGEPMYDQDGGIKYVESNFIKAIKNGWMIEVQEPYVIAKQGVLTALNGLLDDNAGITLPNGEFVKRHPDTVVVFTTNVSYVGCKKPNQSVLRRMNNVYDVLMPSDDEIKQRIIANTGFNNSAILDKMIDCMNKINTYLIEEMIDDGVCGISELIDWVSTFQITKNIILSAQSTIVSKATDDTLEQSKVSGIIESLFKNTDTSEQDILNF